MLTHLIRSISPLIEKFVRENKGKTGEIVIKWDGSSFVKVIGISKDFEPLKNMRFF